MSKFRGADSGLLIAVIVAIGLSTGPLAAAAAQDGQAAFDNQDYSRAETLWRQEAAQGSAQAMLGLGLLEDLGLGGSRDPSTALQWYLQAASLGLADAQFNAAVMLDSGIGVGRQPQAAAAWYGRAAAQGHVRASYALALLLAAGDGVPKNADLARYWLLAAQGQLGAVDGALERLVPPKPEERVLSAPIPLAGSLVQEHAELVWAAGPAPEGVDFGYEIVGRPGPGSFAQPLATGATQANATRIELPAGPAQLAWRVYRAAPDGAGYATGPWRSLSGGDAPPTGILQIRVARGDAGALRLARDLMLVFEGSGYWTEIRQQDEAPAAQTQISYGDERDAKLASEIASFLPGQTLGTAQQELDASPGTIVLQLVGGPAD